MAGDKRKDVGHKLQQARGWAVSMTAPKQKKSIHEATPNFTKKALTFVSASCVFVDKTFTAAGTDLTASQTSPPASPRRQC